MCPPRACRWMWVSRRGTSSISGASHGRTGGRIIPLGPSTARSGEWPAWVSHPGAGGRLPKARRGRVLWHFFVPLGGACPPSGARSRRRPLESVIHHHRIWLAENDQNEQGKMRTKTFFIKPWRIAVAIRNWDGAVRDDEQPRLKNIFAVLTKIFM